MPKEKGIGGGGGGVSDWHRQQRKRELAKNKTARIAARDAKVKESKSVAGIQEEIQAIERQFKVKDKEEAVIPHGVKSKLDRLRKELKLVQQAQDEANRLRESQQQQLPQHLQQQHQQPAFEPLPNPQVSVYYDPVLNPYGAPPPGQPKLYHRVGGGVTMNLNEACLPGGHPLVPPPPPPPSPFSFGIFLLRH